MDEFEQIAADLQKSIEVDETAGPLTDEHKELLKDPANVTKALALGIAALAKAKGAQTTDLSQDKAPKSKTVTEVEPDPAEHPVKSGRGYKDTKPYIGKGDEEDDDDKPNFFGKKKKVKKSAEEDDDEVDVTEFTGEMAKAINYLIDEVAELRKSQAELLEGSGIFGQVLHEVAANDPRRDNLSVNVAKALSFVVNEVKEIKKGLSTQADLFKSVAEMPGVPRAAGIALIKSEHDGAAGAGVDAGQAVSKGDRSRLYKAAVEKKITMDEYKDALAKGDTSILARIGS